MPCIASRPQYWQPVEPVTPNKRVPSRYGWRYYRGEGSSLHLGRPPLVKLCTHTKYKMINILCVTGGYDHVARGRLDSYWNSPLVSISTFWMNVCCHSARGGESNQLALAVSVAKRRGVGWRRGKRSDEELCAAAADGGRHFVFIITAERERDRRRENDIRLYKRLMSYWRVSSCQFIIQRPASHFYVPECWARHRGGDDV